MTIILLSLVMSVPYNPIIKKNPHALKYSYQRECSQHERKLAQIRQKSHITSFHNCSPKKPKDFKGAMLAKMKHLEISAQNQLLRKKISKIQHNQFFLFSTHSPVRYQSGNYPQQSNRYRNKQELAKNHKFTDALFPLSSTFKSKQKVSPEDKPDEYETIVHKSILAETLKNKGKALSLKKHNRSITSYENKLLFQNQPINQADSNKQLQSNRQRATISYERKGGQSIQVVVFKKTKIVEPFCSYLIEMSWLGKKFIIIASSIESSKIYQRVLEGTQAQNLYENCNKSYEIIWQKIKITSKGIKIIGNKDKDRKVNHKEAAGQIKTKFLERNYYKLIEKIGKRQNDRNDNSPQTQHRTATAISGNRQSYVRKRIEDFITKNPQLGDTKAPLNKSLHNATLANDYNRAVLNKKQQESQEVDDQRMQKNQIEESGINQTDIVQTQRFEEQIDDQMEQ